MVKLDYRSSSDESGPLRARDITTLLLLAMLVIISAVYWMLQPSKHSRLGQVDAAKVEVAKADISTIRSALETFKADTGRYPSSNEGLDALLACPNALSGRWKGPYMDKLSLDPWGYPYIYCQPGTSGHTYTITYKARDGTIRSSDE